MSGGNDIEARYTNAVLMGAGLGKLMRGLHPQDRIGFYAESLLKPDRRFGREPGMTVEQGAHRLARNAKMTCGSGDAQSIGFDDLSAQPFAGVDRECNLKRMLSISTHRLCYGTRLVSIDTRRSWLFVES